MKGVLVKSAFLGDRYGWLPDAIFLTGHGWYQPGSTVQVWSTGLRVQWREAIERRGPDLGGGRQRLAKSDT